MNQDLEAFIKAYLAVRENGPGERVRNQAIFDDLIDKHLEQFPNISREMLLEAIRRRALAYLKAQTQPPSIPPQA